MSLKPWREIARPHLDVLEGTFKQSEFAADISLVAAGNATKEYQDAEMFFSRTFITEGMRLLLISVAQRLAGKGGDPVIQLQTAFGGGKTHTMLAVYHLASRKVSASRLDGVSPVLDEAGIPELPSARVAVIDGIKLSPNQPQQHGSIKANTLWGELAWQLLGAEGYAMVAESDNTATSPGKQILTELIQKAAPCVILLDELVAFFRQLDSGKEHKAGSFETNLSFIQALTETMKAVPNAVLLGALPESDLEVGGQMGRLALESLEKYFARVESVWKPVATEEAFEIVRRRLFDSVGDQTERDQVCREFADFYRHNKNKFPAETQESGYLERLRKSYPIHPEIFDRLYEDWSTLDKFQRTRGVLQYMAIVIHRLWNSDNKDAMIMPGSIPLEDSNVRIKSTHYLPQGWDPVIEREIDGQNSEPARIDGSADTRFGSVHAARRAARTIFLGSAPSSTAQTVRGIAVDHILLGSVQPGQNVSIFEDVLKRLRDKLHYLYADGDRLWFDTKPNLRREMESRKDKIKESDLLPVFKDYVNRIIGRAGFFSGIHIFTPSGDVPDDFGSGPRLVVLPPNETAAYIKAKPEIAYDAASAILNNRGEQPRLKRNRLIFLAADYDIVSRLRDQCRTMLAWKDIVTDIENGRMNLDLHQANQAKTQYSKAEEILTQVMRETYKYIIAPAQINATAKLSWDVISIATNGSYLIQQIETTLREEEMVITNWSPIHLKTLLTQWYFKDGVTEICAQKVWQDCCTYFYMPRLLNGEVFEAAVRQGVNSEDYFAYAAGKDENRYMGFEFGNMSSLSLGIDDYSLLIERHAALAYKEANKPKIESAGPEEAKSGETMISGASGEPLDANAQAGTSVKHRFYGMINVEPVKAKLDFATVVDEVIQHFTQTYGVKVKISIDIQAESPTGFPDTLQRTIKENCTVLKFNSAEFED